MKNLTLNQRVTIKSDDKDLSEIGFVKNETEKHYEIELMWNGSVKHFAFAKFTRKFSKKTLKAVGHNIFINK